MSSPFALLFSASTAIERHCPCAKHAGWPGHAMRSHAPPAKPSAQMHWPFVRSHEPALLHSTFWCARSLETGSSNQEGCVGQARSEQSALIQPDEQRHLYVDAAGGLMQTPWPEHSTSPGQATMDAAA